MNDMHRSPTGSETYHFGKKLTKDTDELIVYKLTALDAWVFEALNLLLNNNFESCRANEKGRC